MWYWYMRESHSSVDNSINLRIADDGPSEFVVSNSIPVSLFFPRSFHGKHWVDFMEIFKRSFIVSLSRRCYSLRHIFEPLTPLVAMGWKTSVKTIQAKVDLANNHMLHAPSSSFRAFFSFRILFLVTIGRWQYFLWKPHDLR